MCVYNLNNLNFVKMDTKVSILFHFEKDKKLKPLTFKMLGVLINLKEDKKGMNYVKNTSNSQIAKRVDIVSLKLVKESSLLYKKRTISSPEDGRKLMDKFLKDADREHFIVISLNTKNEPVNINICHIGSLNARDIHLHS